MIVFCQLYVCLCVSIDMYVLYISYFYTINTDIFHIMLLHVKIKEISIRINAHILHYNIITLIIYHMFLHYFDSLFYFKIYEI